MDHPTQCWPGHILSSLRPRPSMCTSLPYNAHPYQRTWAYCLCGMRMHGKCFFFHRYRCRKWQWQQPFRRIMPWRSFTAHRDDDDQQDDDQQQSNNTQEALTRHRADADFTGAQPSQIGGAGSSSVTVKCSPCYFTWIALAVAALVVPSLQDMRSAVSGQPGNHIA